MFEQKLVAEEHPAKDNPSKEKPAAAAQPDLPNASETVYVTEHDLPLHCPMPGKRLWDSHPKVFLPIADSGKQKCPYCGTLYVLKPSADH